MPSAPAWNIDPAQVEPISLLEKPGSELKDQNGPSAGEFLRNEAAQALRPRIRVQQAVTHEFASARWMLDTTVRDLAIIESAIESGPERARITEILGTLQSRR